MNSPTFPSWQGASYNHFAGRDGARAFVTGCFKTHLTHDIRGFSEKEQKVGSRVLGNEGKRAFSYEYLGTPNPGCTLYRKANDLILVFPFFDLIYRHWKVGNHSLIIIRSIIKLVKYYTKLYLKILLYRNHAMRKQKVELDDAESSLDCNNDNA